MNLTKAKDIIKEFEGYSKKAYQCSAGVWTVGYGSTRWLNGEKITEKDSADKYLAEMLLDAEVKKLYQRISDLCHPAKLTDNQLSALISFVYNVGIDAFKKSTMLKLIIANKPMLAAAEFNRWNKANGKVLKGLVNRRKKERELFLS